MPVGKARGGGNSAPDYYMRRADNLTGGPTCAERGIQDAREFYCCMITEFRDSDNGQASNPGACMAKVLVYLVVSELYHGT